MPRKICQMCERDKIVYRLHALNGPTVEICEACARIMLRAGRVFNLRRILSIALGTKEREEYSIED